MMSICYLLHLGVEMLIVNLLSMCRAALCCAGLTLWLATVLLLLVVLQGKQQAEQELFRSYPETGVALRPWIIYGDRALRSVTFGCSRACLVGNTVPAFTPWHKGVELATVKVTPVFSPKQLQLSGQNMLLCSPSLTSMHVCSLPSHAPLAPQTRP